MRRGAAKGRADVSVVRFARVSSGSGRAAGGAPLPALCGRTGACAARRAGADSERAVRAAGHPLPYGGSQAQRRRDLERLYVVRHPRGIRRDLSAAVVSPPQPRDLLPDHHGGAARNGAVCVPQNGRTLVPSVCVSGGRRAVPDRRNGDCAAALRGARAAAPGAVYPRRGADCAGRAVSADRVFDPRHLRRRNAMVVAVSPCGAHAGGAAADRDRDLRAAAPIDSLSEHNRNGCCEMFRSSRFICFTPSFGRPRSAVRSRCGSCRWRA